MVRPKSDMKSYAFLWSCPSCGEYVSTELPPREEDAVLVCPACGSRFGEKSATTAGEAAERKPQTA
jgi:predicted RNA-binding Zn-ribbon protein involved in translation (DUF1610 family)